MSTIDTSTALRDLELLCANAATGQPVDAALAARVRDRTEEAQRELRSRGLTNIAVDLIREGRDE